MSLSFSVSSGFIRPFMNMLNGACKLSDYIHILPGDSCIEIISVHHSQTAHLLITIDAIHLEGYRYRRLARGTGGGGGDGIDRADIDESLVPATAESRDNDNSNADDADAGSSGHIIASATTYGNNGSNVNIGTTPPSHVSDAAAGHLGGEEDVTLRVPTAALLNTLLHQNATIHSLNVSYLSAEVEAEEPAGGGNSNNTFDVNNMNMKFNIEDDNHTTTTTTTGRTRRRSEMLCLECQLSTGVVKSYQLHLVQGSPMRVAAADLSAYHLEVRGEAKMLGNLLAGLPSTSPRCMVSPLDGRLELRWSQEGGVNGGGGGSGGGGCRGRRSSGGRTSSNQYDVTAEDKSGSMAAVVSAQRSSFVSYQYFSAAATSEDNSNDSSSSQQRRGMHTGPEVVAAVPFYPLPSKIMDVKPFKIATWLANQLGQQLQIVLGDAGTPMMFRTGAAAETFIISHDPQQAAAAAAAAAAGSGGFVPICQPPNSNTGSSAGGMVYSHNGGGGWGASGDTLLYASFTLHVATSDVGSQAVAAGGVATVGSSNNSTSANVNASRQSGAASAAVSAFTTPRNSTSHHNNHQQQQHQLPTRISAMPASAVAEQSAGEPLFSPSAAASNRNRNATISSSRGHEQQVSAGPSHASTQYPFPSHATTLVMGGTSTDESGTSSAAWIRTSGGGAVDPFLTPLAPATPSGNDDNKHANGHQYRNSGRSDVVIANATADTTPVAARAAATQLSSIGSISHVSASYVEGTPFTPQPIYHNTNDILIDSTVRSLVMIDSTPRASGALLASESLLPPLPSAAPAAGGGASPPSFQQQQQDGSNGDIYIYSLSPHDQQQQQQQHLHSLLALQSGANSVGGVGVGAAPALGSKTSPYPLDYALFASRAATTIGLSLMGRGGGGPSPGSSSTMASCGIAVTAGGGGGGGEETEDGSGEDMGEDDEGVDKELEQFLDSCLP